jgi:hypothetical protein
VEERFGLTCPPSTLNIDPVMSATRTKLHLVCMFKNPKSWRFYLKGILREFGINA